MDTSWIIPNWPAPPNILACSTTRQDGFSVPPYDGLNLGEHVGDNNTLVYKNRLHLMSVLGLSREPFWLQQVHSNRVVEAYSGGAEAVEADASFSRNPGDVCVVLTADCLPVLICDRGGSTVAAVHAGWRGLAAGIIEEAIRYTALPAAQLLVWLGPAIGPAWFEVGPEVRELFLSSHADTAAAFDPTPNGRYLANLYDIARVRLKKLGITDVYGGDYCTYQDEARFFSYRRDNKTGRMASLISIKPVQ